MLGEKMSCSFISHFLCDETRWPPDPSPKAKLQEWLMRLELVWRQVLRLQTPLCSVGPTTAAAAPLPTTWYQRHWASPTKPLQLHFSQQKEVAKRSWATTFPLKQDRSLPFALYPSVPSSCARVLPLAPSCSRAREREMLTGDTIRLEPFSVLVSLW